MSATAMVPKHPSYPLVGVQYALEGDRLELEWTYAPEGVVELTITAISVGAELVTLHFDPEEAKPYLTAPVLHFAKDDQVSIGPMPMRERHLDRS